MTEPRNPLEFVEEALALYADPANYAVSGGQSVLGTLSLHMGDVHTDGGERARAALALVRKMRADAVVGWADADARERYQEFTVSTLYDKDMSTEACPMVPALLLPLPLLDSAIAALTHKEPSDVD